MGARMIGTGIGRAGTWAVTAAIVAASVAVTSDAFAQASGCEALQSHLLERRSIAEKLSAGGKKQMDAKVACAGFVQLVQNGDKLLKWTTANKDWCQIPDSFVESIQVDHNKAVSIRTRACGVAAKQQQMERQAKSGGGGGNGGGLLGGGGLSGSSAMPAGAL